MRSEKIKWTKFLKKSEAGTWLLLKGKTQNLKLPSENFCLQKVSDTNFTTNLYQVNLTLCYQSIRRSSLSMAAFGMDTMIVGTLLYRKHAQNGGWPKLIGINSLILKM